MAASLALTIAVACCVGAAQAEALDLRIGTLELIPTEPALAPSMSSEPPTITLGSMPLSVTIEGTGNTVLPSASEGNRIAVSMRGDGNGGGDGAFERLLPGGLVAGTLSQTGTGNAIALGVTGDRNLFAAAQSGGGNLVTGSITGSGNIVAAVQNGAGNALSFSQVGDGNSLSVSQVSW